MERIKEVERSHHTDESKTYFMVIELALLVEVMATRLNLQQEINSAMDTETRVLKEKVRKLESTIFNMVHKNGCE